LVAVGTILGRADEHLDEVVVQRIVELALETPFKLGMIEVPWMEVEIIGMHGHGLIFELDDDLYSITLGARREVQEGMLVQAELRENAIKAGSGGFRHSGIVKQIVGSGGMTNCPGAQYENS
jgi:hypothetical protein